VTAGASPIPELAEVPQIAGLRRRLVSLIYEALILAAILLAGALPVALFTRGWNHAAARATLQIWLMVLCGAFYIWQWRGAGHRKGQTLPMKTWRMQLVTSQGATLSTQRALARYAAAYLSLVTLGFGYLWALLDRDQQFLHDRIAGTRLVMTADASR
jgi:uncharacterized RDD family membrane protein YckC